MALCGLASVVISHTPVISPFMFETALPFFSSDFIFIIHGEIKSRQVIRMNTMPYLKSTTKKPLLRNSDEFGIWERFFPTRITSDVL